jgi:LytS/YehU family sensor histidine kinase
MAAGGDIGVLMSSKERLAGLMLIGITALGLGVTVTLSALVHRSESEARAQALRFELERKELERQALDARLSLLQAQVQPHFLFNTLANVQALVEVGSPRAAPVLKSLIAYLRAAVPKLQGGRTRLADELALVEAYLALMQMRMPDRLSYSVQAPAGAEELACPPLALLTLAENAVRHGIDPAEDGGRIDVIAQLEPTSGSLVLEVADTGVGMKSHAPAGTGLSNLRARLAALHGTAASLVLHQNAPHGVRATITLPASP